MRPHFGTIGVAADHPGLLDSIPPSSFGGNIDNWRMGIGTKLFLPISLPGAMLSLGGLGEAAPSEVYKQSSLDLAQVDAFRKARRFLMTAHGLSEDEAISLLSVAVDFGITQGVDGNRGAHAIIPKALFAQWLCAFQRDPTAVADHDRAPPHRWHDS